MNVDIHLTSKVTLRNEFPTIAVEISSLHIRDVVDLSYDTLQSAFGQPEPISLDLLLIASIVYLLDKAVPRSTARDLWTREFAVIAHLGIFGAVALLRCRFQRLLGLGDLDPEIQVRLLQPLLVCLLLLQQASSTRARQPPLGVVQGLQALLIDASVMRVAQQLMAVSAASPNGKCNEWAALKLHTALHLFHGVPDVVTLTPQNKVDYRPNRRRTRLITKAKRRLWRSAPFPPGGPQVNTDGPKRSTSAFRKINQPIVAKFTRVASKSSRISG